MADDTKQALRPHEPGPACCPCSDDLANASDDIDMLRGLLQQAVDVVRQGIPGRTWDGDTYAASVPRSYVDKWDAALKETLR